MSRLVPRSHHHRKPFHKSYARTFSRNGMGCSYLVAVTGTTTWLRGLYAALTTKKPRTRAQLLRRPQTCHEIAMHVHLHFVKNRLISKGARRPLLQYKVYGDSALLVFNWISLIYNNALLALNWRCVTLTGRLYVKVWPRHGVMDRCDNKEPYTHYTLKVGYSN